MICPHCDEIITPEEMDITKEWEVLAHVLYHKGFPVAQFLPNLDPLVMQDAIDSLRGYPIPKQMEVKL